MVRVGGLQLLREQGKAKPDPAGLTPAEQLAEISRHRPRRWSRTSTPACWTTWSRSWPRPGIRRLDVDRARRPSRTRTSSGCSSTRSSRCSRRWPWTSDEPFPLLPGLGLNLVRPAEAARRAADMPAVRRRRRARAGWPGSSPCRPRRGYHYVLLEDVVAAFLDRLFPGEPVLESVAVPHHAQRRHERARGRRRATCWRR